MLHTYNSWFQDREEKKSVCVVETTLTQELCLFKACFNLSGSCSWHIISGIERMIMKRMSWCTFLSHTNVRCVFKCSTPDVWTASWSEESYKKLYGGWCSSNCGHQIGIIICQEAENSSLQLPSSISQDVTAASKVCSSPSPGHTSFDHLWLYLSPLLLWYQTLTCLYRPVNMWWDLLTLPLIWTVLSC